MPYRILTRCWLLLSLSSVAITACATTEKNDTNKTSGPVYFSDCGMVNLKTSDASQMTKAERIAAEDAALLDALEDNSECNQQALVSGQKSVSAAASAVSGEQTQTANTPQSGSMANAGEPNNASVGQNPNATSTQQQTAQIISGTTGSGGAETGVNGQEITICQISRENLAAATTPEDKTFWQGEVSKNCR